MTELKTLKDIDLIIKTCPKSEKDNLIKYIENKRKSILKAEAIKWVKALNYDNDDIFEVDFGFPDTCKNDDENKKQSEGAITILKHFFNITEEDLK
jgi:hypothetical protein